MALNVNTPCNGTDAVSGPARRLAAAGFMVFAHVLRGVGLTSFAMALSCAIAAVVVGLLFCADEFYAFKDTYWQTFRENIIVAAAWHAFFGAIVGAVFGPLLGLLAAWGPAGNRRWRSVIVASICGTISGWLGSMSGLNLQSTIGSVDHGDPSVPFFWANLGLVTGIIVVVLAGIWLQRKLLIDSR